MLAKHLSPGLAGKRERETIRSLLTCKRGDDQAAEIMRLVSEPGNGALAESGPVEAKLVRELARRASMDLAGRFEGSVAYEGLCEALETSFENLRYLSSSSRRAAVGGAELDAVPTVSSLAHELRDRIQRADDALSRAPLPLQAEIQKLCGFFDGVSSGAELFDAMLRRHAEVQKAKPPDGKREWFEPTPDGRVFVRPPYRPRR
jgi:hypothetical protein